MNAGVPLLQISGLSHAFTRNGGIMGKSVGVKAVDDVTLALSRRKTLGLVGESGSGKSTLAKMVVHLLAPSSGNVLLDGQPLYPDHGKKPDRTFLRSLPSRLQMVFQDPYSSLNPRLKIGYSIAEPLICAGASRAASSARVAELLNNVGLGPKDAARYPHEFSGGQRQRIALARALAPRPDIIICDEPASSLDASVQAQVLNLLKDSQDTLELTYLFISHDLAVVSHMSDQVAVMYLGRIVELGETDQIFTHPLHPYTAVLLEAATGRKKAVAKASAQAVGGQPPVEGCAFAPRCPKMRADCLESAPELEFKETRQVRCFYPG